MSVNNHFYASLNNRESLLQEDLIVVNRRLLALLDSVSILQQHEEEILFENKLDEKRGEEISHHIENYAILLIEDNLVAQRISQSQLKGFNCHVDIADTGEEALNLLQNKHYDLILLDIGLPDHDGRDIVREIRAEQGGPNRESPIIALTAHLPDEEKHTCFEVGIDHILYKPLTAEDVKSIFNTFLGTELTHDSENVMAPPADDEQIDDTKSLPVIDLAAAAKLMQCNEDNVKRLLTMLVESLPEEQANMEQAYQSKSWDQLRKVVHKLNGGSGYCGVMRLKKICATLETTLVVEQHDEKKIDTQYQQLLQEIAAILEAFSKL